MTLESLQQPGVIAAINASIDDDDLINDPDVQPVGYTWELMDDDSWELIPNYWCIPCRLSAAFFFSNIFRYHSVYDYY